MNRHEIDRLLKACAGRDNRPVDPLAIDAWHTDLADIMLMDALDAVSVHYRTSSRRIMPADIRGHADLMRAARAEARASEGAFGPTMQAHSTRDRGVRLTTYVLEGLAVARRAPGWHKQPAAVRRARAANIGEKLMTEALRLYPDTSSGPADRRAPCRWSGCTCSHDVDPFTGERCSGGWLMPPDDSSVQGDLFDPAAEGPAVFVAEADDQVRPCPTCASERARILSEGGERRRVQQRVRARADR